METSLKILDDFFKRNNIEININDYLCKHIISSSDNLNKLPEDIVNKVIIDAYNSNSELLKEISNNFTKKYQIYLGRVHKNQLKKYLDYNFLEDFDLFFNLISENEILNKKEVKKFIDEYLIELNHNETLGLFFTNFNEVLNKNKKRTYDYLVFLYSRLINMNERKKISLFDLYSENKEVIEKDFNSDFNKELKSFVSYEKIDRIDCVNLFNKKFIKLLESHNGDSEKYGLIYLNLNQTLFDKFNSEKEFYNYLFNLIKKIYKKLENHKSFIIKVDNIIYNDINIKWDLYSKLTIFSENFISEKENRPYYKPELICLDLLEKKFKLILNKDEIKNLENYYKGKIKYEQISSNNIFLNNEVKDLINSFNNINYGFSFIDCNILLSNQKFKNSKEINFVENKNELLLTFIKHKIDERKIPCPVCASLKISGNSYPEIGIKSWECKNPLCSERSKTNRGKRYSEKTIFMQNSNYDFSKENLISKDLIKIWRKDVVENWDYKDLFSMIIKYFSYPNDKVLFLINEENKIIEDITLQNKRQFTQKNIDNFLPLKEIDNVYEKFFNNDLFQYIFYKNDIVNQEVKLNISNQNNIIKILNGDCLNILSNLKSNSIHNMVTSPPYYNAREYSQWQNLFTYLTDMYNMALHSYNVLDDGGVYFFNIGDIFDNPKTIVKSKMGERRVPLGAYTILLFQKAGFELLDNIIWYKGETQSNRHKNDGNYTPFYQKPANCYEHMFIFKKKGKIRLNKNFNENILKSNVIKFTPVFKIGAGGVNRYGHTAPYPKLIPELSIKCFSNEKEIILDPYLGSGTSSIVAVENKRVGVGIELNEDYSKLALEKIRENNFKAEISKHFF